MVTVQFAGGPLDEEIHHLMWCKGIADVPEECWGVKLDLAGEEGEQRTVVFFHEEGRLWPGAVTYRPTAYFPPEREPAVLYEAVEG
jgi:hypothetical protein